MRPLKEKKYDEEKKKKRYSETMPPKMRIGGQLGPARLPHQLGAAVA